MSQDGWSEWQRRLGEECPHQVVLPRQQLGGDDEVMAFLAERIGEFDMYVEDDHAVFVR